MMGIFFCSSVYLPFQATADFQKEIIWNMKKGTSLTLLAGLITTDHSPVRSHYWSTRRLLAAGLPLWPDAPLLRQPDPLGLPRGGHADADLSADASSTWFGCNQYSLPHIIPISDFPDAGLQKFATLPVRMIGENYLSELAFMYNVYTYEEKSAMSIFEWLFSLCVKRERERERERD